MVEFQNCRKIPIKMFYRLGLANIQGTNILTQTIPLYRKKMILKHLYIPASSNNGTFFTLRVCDPCPSFWTFVEYSFTWFSVQKHGWLQGTMFETFPNVAKFCHSKRKKILQFQKNSQGFLYPIKHTYYD